jgi:tetratricopeptide (TPR) repeat protein
VRDAATGAVERGSAARPRRPERPLPEDVREELEAQAGGRRAPRLAERLEAARGAFERERYQDARRMLTPVVQEAPGSASARELNGLTLYRLERYRQAATELEAYRTITGAVDQHPVLMDSYRALRRWARVDALWEELKAASPAPAIMVEGRIVMAGSLADRGDLRAALAVAAPADTKPKKVREHHLRLWYVLGDLYDRSGDTPRARSYFARIRDADPSFADVEQRLRSLGR